MNLQIKTTEVHERRHTVAMTADQVREILINAAVRAAGVTGAVECVAEFGAPVEFTLTELVGFELPETAASAKKSNMQKMHTAPAKPLSVTAPTSKPTKAPAVMSKATAWTADEDELIVSRRAGDLRELSTNAASHALAEVLPQRTQGAIYLRIKSKLAERIDAAMDAVDLAALDARVATERAVGTPLALRTTNETPTAERAALRQQDESARVLPLWQIEIGQRLDALDNSAEWSVTEDHELVELLCTGWKLGTAAERLERDVSAARERWQQLVRCTTGREFRPLTSEEQQRLATTLKARKG